MHTCFSIQHHSTAQVPGGGPLRREAPLSPPLFPLPSQEQTSLVPTPPAFSCFFLLRHRFLPSLRTERNLSRFPFREAGTSSQNAPFHQTPFGSPLGPPHPRLITILEEPLVSRSRSTSLLYLLLAPRSALTEGQVRITPQHLLPLRHASLQVDGIPSPSTASSRHSALAPSIFKARIFGH